MKQRIRWLDTAKGIGIFLVVTGHCLTSSIRADVPAYSLIYELIYSFHMPFLIFLSGYSFFLAQNRYGKMHARLFFCNKAGSFLLPYLIYNLLLYLFFTACSFIPSLSRLLTGAGYGSLSFSGFHAGLLTGGNAYCYPSWYLYGLFFYSAAAYAVLRFFPEKKFRQRISCILISLISLSLHFFTPLGAMDGMRDITFFFPWFFLGWQLGEKRLPCRFCFPCLLVPLLIFFIQSAHPLSDNVFLLHSGKILLSTAAVLALVTLLPRLSGPPETLFHFLGRHSMEIYLFHQPLIGSFLGTLLYQIADLPAWLTIILTISLCFLLPLIAAYILRKNLYTARLFALQTRG